MRITIEQDDNQTLVIEIIEGTGHVARPAHVPSPGGYRSSGPGVGVLAASRILGVAEQTVRRWAEAGRIASTHDDRGRLRILGLDAPEQEETP